MKNLILVIAATALISLNVSAQKSKDVPASVKATFSQKFSKATDVKWGKEGKTEWEAEFKLDGKAHSANFDLKGAWIESEYAITASEIPAAVKTVIDKDYAGYKMKVSEVSETTKGKVYEFTFVKEKVKKDVALDVNGKAVKE
jgi:hypothetical protein